jgi:hypothetical protein
MYTLLTVDVGQISLDCLLDISAMATFNTTFENNAKKYVNYVYILTPPPLIAIDILGIL